MTPALLESYRNASYELHLPHGRILLAVDRQCPQLGELLVASGCASAAFLTAFNPGSQLLADATNSAAQKQLEQRLLQAGYRLIPGMAIDPTGLWPPEPGLFIAGISLADAMSVAHDFQQLAFLWCGADAVLRLVETGHASR